MTFAVRGFVCLSQTWVGKPGSSVAAVPESLDHTAVQVKAQAHVQQRLGAINYRLAMRVGELRAARPPMPGTVERCVPQQPGP